MKVLLSWLNEFAPIGNDAEQIGDIMSDLGMAVEEMASIGGGFDGVVVAKILSIDPIEGADRIRAVLVDVGESDPVPVVCGASNISVGDVVPFATVGAVLPGDFEIKARKMKGVESQGMLCSTRELGLGADHQGIWLLDDQLALGLGLREALGMHTDVLYDLEINPNRPDAMSVAGVARDVAGRMGVPFDRPFPDATHREGSSGIEVTIDVLDTELCGRFHATVLRNVTSGTSPQWMANRLTQLGMRPINALVDISNYVMLELGQPNHPYDLAKVPGGGLRVRRARENETLVTLDDVERQLTSDDLLICGADDTAVGIAGVMGGASCEIDASTTDVLLENAWFLPMAISRTSRRLGLRTEASARFEKGGDPEVLELAAARFAQLATEICGAETFSDAISVEGDVPERSPILVRTDKVNEKLGTDLDPGQMRALLGSIGFDSTNEADGNFAVTIPSWRYDSSSEIDVVEEIARMYGYANIPSTPLAAARFGQLSSWQSDRRALRRAMVGLGLSEVQPMPFLAPDELGVCGLSIEGIELLNPLVAAESVLRPSLLPGLVQAVAHNAQRQLGGVQFFEIGHTFGAPAQDQLLPDERERLGVIRAGHEVSDAIEAWQLVVDTLALEDVCVINEEVPGLHPTRSGRVQVSGVIVGEVGEIDPQVAHVHGISERCAWLSIDLSTLSQIPHGERPYRTISRFPFADVDLAFVVDATIPVHEVERTIKRAVGDLLADIALFDVFRDDSIGAGARSLTFALRFQAPDRTLSDADVSDARQRAIDAVVQTHAAPLRS